MNENTACLISVNAPSLYNVRDLVPVEMFVVSRFGPVEIYRADDKQYLIFSVSYKVEDQFS